MTDLPTKPATGLERAADAATPPADTTDPVEAVVDALASEFRADIFRFASRERIAEAAIAKLTALGWESPGDVALIHAIKDQFAQQVREAQRETAELRVRLDDQKTFAEGLMAAADSLRADLAAFGDGPSWKTLWREFQATTKRMTELTDENAALRRDVDRLETTVSILEDSDPFSYDDCRDDCDGCHEGAPMCDCHVPAAEARARIRDLRDRVERAEEQVADALALCTEIRSDSVIGTSAEARLGLVRDRLAMKAGAHRLDPATIAPRWVGSEPQEPEPSCACGAPWAGGKCVGGGDRG